VPLYVIGYGILGSCIGLWTFGDRVITTIATKVSKINAASGFTIEFGAALTSLLASKLGLPISTTHCLYEYNLRTIQKSGNLVIGGAYLRREYAKVYKYDKNTDIHHFCPKQPSIPTFLNH
uniref:Chloride channel protein n=1 Tax=Angiostrongylus cantonensis TaxID=6313 RepID=A0A0K0D5I8_ANGCA